MRRTTRMHLASIMAIVMTAMGTNANSHAGIMVGSSSLIGSLDYSDTWTTTANGGNADRIDSATPSATALIVENAYGNPSQSWTSSIWEIRTDATAFGSTFTPYPGGSGSGSSTGLAQSLTDSNADFGIEYGLRNEYVVQFDATQTLDRIDITTAAVRDTIEDLDGLSVFFRPNFVTFAPEIGLYNLSVGETDTGLASSIVSGVDWHNYAVRFDLPDDEIEIFVDEISLGTIDLGTFASGSYANIMNNSAVSIGGSGTIVHVDNFQVGAAVPEPGAIVLLSCAIGGLAIVSWRRRRQLRRVGLPMALLIAALPAAARAEQIIFTLDVGQSTLSLGGTDDTYGPLVAQAPGSNVAPISGHFLAEFDPSAPTDITFHLGHGFMQPAVTGNWLPGPINQADTDDPSNGDIDNPYPGYNTPAPAELAVQTSGGEYRYASRNGVWDFLSVNPSSLPPEPFDPYSLTPDPIPLSGGNFDLATLGYVLQSQDWVLVGENYRFPGDFFGHAHDSTGSAGYVTGSASLQESAPGSGLWTISGTATVVDRYAAHLDPRIELGTQIWTADFVATAQFGTANTDSIAPGEMSGSVLGGASTTGGVDVGFDTVTSAGTLSAQQIPTEGLSSAALEALDSVANFQLPGDTPQIWDITFDGEFSGLLTVTLAYDESLLDGVAEESLFVWHYDSALDDWEQLFGTVDTDLNTITVSTDSLSPFILGVPEPSALVLAAFGLAALAACGRCRKRA